MQYILILVYIWCKQSVRWRAYRPTTVPYPSNPVSCLHTGVFETNTRKYFKGCICYSFIESTGTLVITTRHVLAKSKLIGWFYKHALLFWDALLIRKTCIDTLVTYHCVKQSGYGKTFYKKILKFLKYGGLNFNFNSNTNVDWFLIIK